MSRQKRKERFMGLLEPLLGDLSRYCLAMTRDPEAGKDLVNDTILAAWEGFEKLRDEEAFLSWLFTIARRTHKRRRRRERLFLPLDQESADRFVSKAPSKWNSADVSALYQALAKLPEVQREAVVLFEISGLSLQEIARVQNVSLSAVKSRVTRGRARLGTILGADTAASRESDQPGMLPASTRLAT